MRLLDDAVCVCVCVCARVCFCLDVLTYERTLVYPFKYRQWAKNKHVGHSGPQAAPSMTAPLYFVTWKTRCFRVKDGKSLLGYALHSTQDS